ncbi:hypothetical protein [Pseudoalteromonas sp. MMG024]|uniref:hypothetical protein n=1 Tax=Pseudoalteromonas sp. MMG024 TaxID=2909980 RepID=UPI001F3E226B|nr:hypothetical protein [Pseudoalteromonas sp. MMG024]MCF6457313.1 hypothetical protein [Pseudoalteromonas sp. MMG024]
MFKPFVQLVVLITLLFAFTGQAVANHFALSVESLNDTHTISSQIDVTSNGSEESDDCCDVECCESDCICPANTCASFLYLSPLAQHPVQLINNTFHQHYMSSPLSRIESPFRPPIFSA